MTAVERKVVHEYLQGGSRASRRRARAPSPTATSSFARSTQWLTGSAYSTLARGRRDAGLTAISDLERGAPRPPRRRPRRASSSSWRSDGPIVDVGSRRRLAGDPARRRAAGPRGDAARGDAAASASSCERWARELPNLRVVWGRAEEQPTDDVRRRGREGARAAAGRRGVVPAARPPGRRGRALGRPERRRRDASRGWPESSPAELADSPPGFLVLRKLGPTPAGFPRRARRCPQASAAP